MRTVACLLLFAVPVFAGPIDDQIVAPYVEVRTDRGTGAGVVIDFGGEQVVLTARHVADGASKVVLVKRHDDDEVETRWAADVLHISEGDADLALLRPRTPIGLKSAKLSANVKVERGEDAWYIGTHTGIHASLEKTIVNRPSYSINDDHSQGRKHLILNGNAWYGNSGGPAFVKRGADFYVVGIVVRLTVLNPRTPIAAEKLDAITAYLGEAGKCGICKCGRLNWFGLAVSDSGREKELVEKITALVNVKFKGDFKVCFRFYAGADMLLSPAELLEMLRDAKVGTPGTRPVWVARIMERLDVDKSGQLSWAEVEVLKERKSNLGTTWERLIRLPGFRFGW